MTADGRYIAITPEIEAMARDIRTAFVNARLKYIPDAKGSGGRSDEFIKAALLCKELGETPDEFVQRQIPEMASRNVWYANVLSSPRLVASRQATAEDTTASVLSLYQFQLETMKRKLTIFTPRAILEDPVSPFTPLFTCVMALRFGVPDIVERFRKDAHLELAANPIARELFSEEIGQI